MKNEPVITIGGVSAVISAIIALVVVLGVQLPDGLEAAIIGVVAAAGPIVAGLISRRKVWSENSHRADKAKAIEETAAAYGYEDA